MPDLGFRIAGAEAVKFAASPQIALKLQVTNNNPAETIHSVALRCQIQLEVTRRLGAAEPDRVDRRRSAEIARLVRRA